MQVILTYDISRRHPEVKQELLNIGFLDRWAENNITYNLPNTTLWHPDILSTQTGRDAFNGIITQLNLNQAPTNIIRVERLMCVQFSTWSGMPGERHA